MVFTPLASPPAQAGGYGVPDRTRAPGTVHIDAIADEIADATITEVAAFGPMTGERLRAEVRAYSFMIAQRVISAAIVREAGHGAHARGAALTLTALTFDYNIAVTTAMATSGSTAAATHAPRAMSANAVNTFGTRRS